MSKIISYFIFSLLIINGSASEDQKQENIEFTPQEKEYAEDFFNFTLGVDEALLNFEDMTNGRTDISQGVSADSSFPVGYILATIKENLIPTAVPGYDSVLKSAKNLPEAYSQLFGKILGSDLKISNTIFTPNTLPDAPSLKTIKAEVKKVDLQSSDAASEINSDISTKIENSVPYTYIPPKATLPKSTKAILISTVHLSSEWPTPLAKVGSTSFNGGEAVDMYEIKGAFPYLESEDALQVTIPFKNPARALVLILPTDINAALRGEMAEPHNGTATSVRIQLPLFSYTVRVPHKAAKSQSSCGGIIKSENFFRLLNDVVHISATTDKFEAVSITGAMINNAAEYKTEVSTVTSQDSQSPIPPPPSANTKVPAQERSDQDTSTEKLIVLNKAFQWRVDDIIMGPIFFGNVESLKSTKSLEADSTSTNNVFGLDDLSYINCL